MLKKLILVNINNNPNTMPPKLEAKLKREAKNKGLGKERANAYTYGTMRKLGLMKKK